MKRPTFPGLIALCFAASSLAVFFAGCGVDNALVGGTCAAGYTQCGLHCVKGSACESVFDGAVDQKTDARDEQDVEVTVVGDGSLIDFFEDGSTGNDAGGDAAVADAAPGDTSSSGADSGEAGSADAATRDGNLDSSDATSSDSNPGDAIANGDATGNDGEAGNPCTVPLAFCGGQCIDVTADPVNCGACGVVCASQICTNSRCVGAASGGIVYVGHDYTTTLAGTAQARVLSNAVFIAQSNPLHVMSYERYARASAIARADAILNGVAAQTGRRLLVTHTTSDAEVPAQLALPGFDVLLVHDQPTAPDGALASLGASWASTLATFSLGGGVIVVLDGGGGIGQMPAFASGTGLLGVSAHSALTVGTPLVVSSRSDVVGIAVISPYGAGQSSVSVSTEPNGGSVVYVVEVATDASGGGAPVVVHKTF